MARIVDVRHPMHMSNPDTIHIVSPDASERGKIARLVFESGYHAEIYANAVELTAVAPRSGIGLVEGREGAEYVERVLRRLTDAGQCLPIVAFANEPSVPDVVRIIKLGAVDFIQTPQSRADIQNMVEFAAPEAKKLRDKRELLAAAQSRLSCLSAREKQVLDCLAQGYSNKTTARLLEISPRTVEIHRMKILAKLGVKNIVEALRYRLLVDVAAA